MDAGNGKNGGVETPKLKCPVENCTWTIEAPTEFEARIKLIAHITAAHKTI